MLLCVPSEKNSVERRNSWNLCNERVVWDGVETSTRRQILHPSREPFPSCGFDGPSTGVEQFCWLPDGKRKQPFLRGSGGWKHPSTRIHFCFVLCSSHCLPCPPLRNQTTDLRRFPIERERSLSNQPGTVLWSPLVTGSARSQPLVRRRRRRTAHEAGSKAVLDRRSKHASAAEAASCSGEAQKAPCVRIERFQGWRRDRTATTTWHARFLPTRHAFAEVAVRSLSSSFRLVWIRRSHCTGSGERSFVHEESGGRNHPTIVQL